MRRISRLVVVKVAICVFVIAAGLFFVKAANLTPFIPARAEPGSAEQGLAQPLTQALFGLEPSVYGFAGVLTAAAVVFFAYTDFEAVANLGEETRQPHRDLPEPAGPARGGRRARRAAPDRSTQVSGRRRQAACITSYREASTNCGAHLRLRLRQ